MDYVILGKSVMLSTHIATILHGTSQRGGKAAVSLFDVTLMHEDSCCGVEMEQVVDVVANAPEGMPVVSGFELVDNHPVVDNKLVLVEQQCKNQLVAMDVVFCGMERITDPFGDVIA
eukprot:217036-Ditylum_brightwellii.AAC.2